MSYYMKTSGQAACCWPVTDENGVESACGRQFTKYDPGQKVCPIHWEAYRREVNKLKWQKRKALLKAKASWASNACP
jgi:hypothetical protein